MEGNERQSAEPAGHTSGAQRSRSKLRPPPPDRDPIQQSWAAIQRWMVLTFSPEQSSDVVKATQVERAQIMVVTVTDGVFPHRIRPLHLPFFVLAQKINFASLLRIHTLHQHFAKYESRIHFLPLLLVTCFEEIINSAFK